MKVMKLNHNDSLHLLQNKHQIIAK